MKQFLDCCSVVAGGIRRPDNCGAVKIIRRMIFPKVSSKGGFSSRLYENMEDFQTASDGHFLGASLFLSIFSFGYGSFLMTERGNDNDGCIK